MQLTPLNSLFSKTTWVSRYQKSKTSLDLNEARDYGVLGWQWHQLDHMQTICTSLQTDNHINTSSINFYRPDALLTPNEQCQSTQGKMTSCKNWKNTILKQKFITNWNIQRNSASVSFNIPGTNLTPNHQDTGMMPWWKTWRKLTWLYFLRKMKNIYISYTHLLNNTLYKVVQHHLSATKTRQMAQTSKLLFFCDLQLWLWCIKVCSIIVKIPTTFTLLQHSFQHVLSASSILQSQSHRPNVPVVNCHN